ncbi:MAG: TlpA family protein disulfide reductase [Candidatus Delongbacteria bacterium]|nr:TlpA family protein disulfide reductase [Candidatus Delongbacteria bacterium]
MLSGYKWTAFIFSVMVLISCSRKEVSPDEFIAEIIKDVEIDLSKINREIVMPDEAEKALRKYQGDITSIWDDIDSLLEKYPESYNLKALKIQFLNRTDKAKTGEFILSLYARDSLNSHNQFLYGTNLEPEAGKSYFVNMIRMKKDDPFGYLGLAFAVLYSGEKDMYIPAKLVYLSILKDPSIDDSFELLSHILNSLDRREDMSVLHGIMLVKDPSNTNAFENLFYYYFSMEENQKAADLLDTFVKNNPELLSNSYIAENYLNIKNYDKASEYLKTARDRKEKDPQQDYIDAKLKIISGEISPAVKLLESYVNSNLNDRTLAFRLTEDVFCEKLFDNKRYLKLLKKVENGAPTIGDKAPSLAGLYFSGSAHDPNMLQNKVYLIDFWAEWCSPCKSEMPNVIAVYERFRSRGFEIIGVNLDNEKDKNKALEYISENSIAWNHIFSGLDWNDPNVSAYKINGIPATILVDGKGVIRYKYIRGEDLLSEKIERLLNEIKQEDPAQ